ncbi:unnamed protein product [Effrenium voratum]|nr:unnamed protein product [Effrenium voratum]
MAMLCLPIHLALVMLAAEPPEEAFDARSTSRILARATRMRLRKRRHGCGLRLRRAGLRLHKQSYPYTAEDGSCKADDEQALMDADLWNQVGSWRVVGYGSQWGKANPAPVSAGSSQRPLIPPSPARLLHPHLRRPRPPKDTMAHRRVRSMSRLSRWSAKARCALQVVRMDARAMCLRELPPDRAARTMLLRLELFLFRMPSWCQVRSQRRAFRYGDVPLSWSGV